MEDPKKGRFSLSEKEKEEIRVRAQIEGESEEDADTKIANLEKKMGEATERMRLEKKEGKEQADFPPTPEDAKKLEQAMREARTRAQKMYRKDV